VTQRVAVVGAREASPETLEKVRAYVRALPAGTIVVSGGADGVDTVAAETARSVGLATIEFAPKVGKIAGMSIARRNNGGPWEMWKSFDYEPSMRDALIFRNTLIALECTRMVAFVQGSKGGTWDAVKQAERFRRPVEIVR